MEIDQLNIAITSDASSATNAIDKLTATLNGLKTVTSSGFTGINKISAMINKLSVASKSMNNIGNAANNINSISNSLKSFNSIGKNNINPFLNSLKKIPEISNAINSSPEISTSKINSLVNAVKPFETMGKNNINSFLNSLKKIPETANALQSIDMDKFAQSISRVTTAIMPLATEMQKVGNGFNALPTKLQRLIYSLDKTSISAKKSSNSFGNLATNLVKIGAIYYTLKRALDLFGNLIKESNDYVENLNLFTVAMGDATEEALKYAETVNKALSIDPSQFIRSQGIFKQIASGFGVVEEKANLMSKNLTTLGYDISSFYNISIEDSMAKLESGITGELEPLRRLGYALDIATLQEVAYSHGITQSLNTMTQAQKSQLRYIAIMEQSSNAMGDMARTVITPANAIRILEGQMTQLIRAIGNMFIPMLIKVMPYIQAVVKLLTELANKLANLMGFSLPKIDYSSSATGLSDEADALSDITDNANEAVKALKPLASFDELNILDFSSGASTNMPDISGNKYDLGLDLPEYDFLAGLDKQSDEVYKKIKKNLSKITAIVSASMLALGAILCLTGANIPLGLGLLAVGAIGLASTIAINWDSMTGQLKSTLTTITTIVGISSLALGAILCLTGANIPLGIALLAIGAASLATSIAINWDSMTGQLKSTLSTITGILAGAFLVLGGLLTLSGVNIPLGLAFMAIGAASLISTVAINWHGSDNKIKDSLSSITGIIAGATLALGAFMCLTGVNIPLGLAFMAVGAVSLVSIIALNWDSMGNKTKENLSKITAIVSASMLALGAILCLTGVGIPLGVALLASGATVLASTIAINWNTMSDQLKSTLTTITTIVGISSLALGAILCFTGVGIPLGVALLAIGAASLATSIGINYNAIKDKIKSILSSLLGIISGSSLVLGVLLCLTGAGIPLGIGLILEGAKGIGTSAKIDENPIITKIKDIINGIIEIVEIGVNYIIDKLNTISIDVPDWLTELTGVTDSGFNIERISIPRLANGGFPDSGQLFIANEAGPEMVGKIGSQTAVVNNGQIETAIEAAVYRAMMMASSSNGGSKIEITVPVQMDKRELGRAVAEYQNNSQIRGGKK